MTENVISQQNSQKFDKQFLIGLLMLVHLKITYLVSTRSERVNISYLFSILSFVTSLCVRSILIDTISTWFWMVEIATANNPAHFYVYVKIKYFNKDCPVLLSDRQLLLNLIVKYSHD